MSSKISDILNRSSSRKTGGTSKIPTNLPTYTASDVDELFVVGHKGDIPVKIKVRSNDCCNGIELISGDIAAGVSSVNLDSKNDTYNLIDIEPTEGDVVIKVDTTRIKESIEEVKESIPSEYVRSITGGEGKYVSVGVKEQATRSAEKNLVIEVDDSKITEAIDEAIDEVTDKLTAVENSIGETPEGYDTVIDYIKAVEDKATGGAAGGIVSIEKGPGISIDKTNPSSPVVSVDSSIISSIQSNTSDIQSNSSDIADIQKFLSSTSGGTEEVSTLDEVIDNKVGVIPTESAAGTTVEYVDEQVAKKLSYAIVHSIDLTSKTYVAADGADSVACQENTIYLTPSSNATTGDSYEEYLCCKHGEDLILEKLGSGSTSGGGSETTEYTFKAENASNYYGSETLGVTDENNVVTYTKEPKKAWAFEGTALTGVDEVKEDGMMYNTAGEHTATMDNANLKDADKMFYSSNITKFTSDMNKVKTAISMFQYCSGLKTFCGNLPLLEDGTNMFEGCNSLSSFIGDLSSLKTAEGMFENCGALSTDNIELIIDLLPTYTDGEAHVITISNSETFVDKAAKKGWTLNQAITE